MSLKKILKVLGVIILIFLVFAACNSGDDNSGNGEDSGAVIENGNGSGQNDEGDVDAGGEEEEEHGIEFAEPSFEPILLVGRGDSIKAFSNVGEFAIAHITGNPDARHFAVESFDSNQKRLDLLVNTTAAYDGIVLLDADTAEFEISAVGDWEIEIRPLVTARSVGVNDEIKITDYNGKISGKNDEVIIVVSNQDSTLVSVTGNSSERHFAIQGYGDGGRDLMVNTTDSYVGTVRLPRGEIVVLEITAVGEWEINFD